MSAGHSAGEQTPTEAREVEGEAGHAEVACKRSGPAAGQGGGLRVLGSIMSGTVHGRSEEGCMDRDRAPACEPVQGCPLSAHLNSMTVIILDPLAPLAAQNELPGSAVPRDHLIHRQSLSDAASTTGAAPARAADPWPEG
eukprot:3939307-Rhodomonas_salina.3